MYTAEIQTVKERAPAGATHYGRYPTGKLFYALEFYNHTKSKLDYLVWFSVQQKYYSVPNLTDKLTEL